MSAKKSTLWETANSPLMVSITSFFLGTVALFWIQGEWESTKLAIVERERIPRLELEYEGRISQYNAWFFELIKDGEFKECVSPDQLRQSIRVLSSKPQNTSPFYDENFEKCGGLPTIVSLYSENDGFSTLGVLLELRLLNMKHRKNENINQKLVSTVNSFLNPDAVVPLRVKKDSLQLKQFRESFMEEFYGIGPEWLWYSDCFTC